MKILLMTCPPIKHGNSPLFMLEKRQNLGIAHLAASLEKAGIEVDFIDLYVKEIDVRSYVEDTKPDWVGISVSTPCFQGFQGIVDSIRDLDIKIVAGGPHCSVLPESIDDRVNHIIIGEGEYSLVDLIKGKIKDRIIKYPPITDLDALPSPKWDIFDKYKGLYWDYMDFLEGRPIISMNTSRGCPYSCRFCSVFSIHGRQYRSLPAKRILEEIKFLEETRGIKGVFMREDHFTMQKERVIEFCKKNEMPFVCEARVDQLPRDLLKIMAEGGCKGIYIGVESGSPRMLKQMNKQITVEQIKECVQNMHELGIKVMASWVVNFIGETEDDVFMTRVLADELKAEINNFNCLIGIPRSWAYDYLLKNKEYIKIDENFLVYPKNYDLCAQTHYGFIPQVKEASEEQVKLLERLIKNE